MVLHAAGSTCVAALRLHCVRTVKQSLAVPCEAHTHARTHAHTLTHTHAHMLVSSGGRGEKSDKRNTQLSGLSAGGVAGQRDFCFGNT